MNKSKQEKERVFLERALSLASMGTGRTGSNPSVGCVLVGDGCGVVGEGRTADGGRPHAERQAIKQAGTRARGSTAYVSLEPCCHEGKSGACTDALISAGVDSVVALLQDVDTRVNGGGFAALVRGGVTVRNLANEPWASDLVEDARRLNAGYILHRTKRRPLVSLKIATSLDGKMGIKGKGSVWLTGDAARRDVHFLRGRYGGIMVGWQTVVLDNPNLDTRLHNEANKREPMPMVIDRDLRLATLLKEKPLNVFENIDKRGLLIFAGENADDKLVRYLQDKGAWVRQLKSNRVGKFSWREVLEVLARNGDITRLLVEGGAGIHTDLLTSSYVDRIYWYRASCLIGDMQGISSWGGGRDEVEKWVARNRHYWDNGDDRIVLEKKDFGDRICA